MSVGVYDTVYYLGGAVVLYGLDSTGAILCKWPGKKGKIWAHRREQLKSTPWGEPADIDFSRREQK